MPQLTQFNALMPIEAFQAGRDQRNQRIGGEFQNALLEGNLDQARTLAQRSGDADMMGEYRSAIQQMNEQQRAEALRRTQILGGTAEYGLQNVPAERVDAWVRNEVAPMLAQQGYDISEMLPQDRPITHDDLGAMVAVAQGAAGELTAYLDRNPGTREIGQYDALVQQRGGQQNVTLNEQGTRALDEQNRSNVRDEELRERGINLDAGRLSLDRDRFNEDRRQFDTARADAQAAAADAAANPPAPDYSAEEDIRTEAERAISEFRDIEAAFTRVRASAENPSAAGDLALIFNFMKMQDPGSTVREGEFATAQNAAGVPDRLRAMYNNVANGQRMTPEQRADFVGRSEALYSAQRQLAEQRLAQYRELTTARQLDERFAIPRFAEFPERSPAPTAPPAQNAPADDLTNRAGRYLVQ